MRQLIKQSTILRRLYFRARKLQAASESDESAIIARLTATATPTFVEFGFHPVEFNCVTLAKNPAWRGLLIDGSKEIVDDARALWPDRIKMANAFLSLDNLG